MRIIDFKKLDVATEIIYDTVVFNFELKDKMDLSVFEFTKLLNADMKAKIDAANLSQYEYKSVVFEFQTDLKNMDLDPMMPALLTSFVKNLNINKSEYKHGEKILAVPQRLNIDKGILMDANALDLINYNLPVEAFNIVFFNHKKKMIRSVLANV
jgi:hypothetical protein